MGRPKSNTPFSQRNSFSATTITADLTSLLDLSIQIPEKDCKQGTTVRRRGHPRKQQRFYKRMLELANYIGISVAMQEWKCIIRMLLADNPISRAELDDADASNLIRLLLASVRKAVGERD